MPQVNKIWVPVVPDARGFREDLKKTLSAVERSLELTIPLAFDEGKLREDVRGALTAAQAEADRAPIDAKVDLDDEGVKRKLKELSDSRKVTINADADTGKARASLLLASRPRTVEFLVNINKASLAKAGTALSALSGLRVAQDAVRNLTTAFSNMDRAVPAISGIALAVGSLSSVALSSVSGIVTFGASLAPLAALAAPLPGLLLAGGLAAGVFAAAMVDAGSQLGSLKPGFAALQDSISSKFWDQAKQPILDLVNGVLPSLQSGLSNVASSLGTWSASVAKSFQTAFSPEVIGTITGALSDSIVASTQGTDAFAASLASLGTFAAQYLPGIGNMFSDLSIRFNGFIQTVVGNGQLAGWVQEATAVLGQLGAVFTNTFGILGNIADAAFAAGGSGIQTLAGALQQINTITAGPAFQGALTTIFAGAADGAQALGGALAPIGDLLVGLAPQIAGALSGLSANAADLISGIASALNQPAVASGLDAALAGISAGIAGLLPALPVLGTLLGAAMATFGQLAAVIGPVLGAALQAVAPLFTAVLGAVMPIAAIAGPLLVQAIQLLAPLFTQLAAVLTPIATALLPVVSAVFAALGPVITTLVAAFQPLVAAIMPLLAAVLAVLMPIIQALAPILTALIPPITQVATLIASVLIVAFQAILPVVQAVISAVVPIVQSLATVITGVVNVISGLLTGNWSQVWQGAQQIVSGVFGVISGVISGAINVIRSVISSGLSVVQSTFSNIFGALGGIVRNAMSAVGTAVSGLKDTVLGAISGAGSWLVSVGKNIFEGLISGLKSMGSSILSAVTGPIKDAISGAKSLLGIHSPSRVFRDEVGKQIVDGFVLGITANASSARSAVEDMAGYVPSLPSFSTSGAGVVAAGAGGVQKTYAPTFQNYGRDFTEQNFLNAMHQIDVLT